MTIAITAALPEEADAFLPGEGAAASLGYLPIRRLKVGGRDVVIATTGIGKVNTASAAALLHSAFAPELFIEIGTCGKLAALAGDCFWLAEAVQHDYGAEEPGRFVHYDAGAWPIGEPSITPYAAIEDPGLGLPHARIASGDAFIACPDQARFLVEGLAADVVDMETGALAQFCARTGTGWAGIKATTDEANGDSAGEFHANLRAAARRAADAAERLLALL